jgi:hypothetical protein
MPTKDKIAQKMFAKSIMVAVQMLVSQVRIEPHFANVLAERLRSIMAPNVSIPTRLQVVVPMDRLTISFFAETENAFRDYGRVTATTIVAITVMKVPITVQRIHANHQNSDVQTEDVFSIHGDVTTKTIVVMVLTNWIANTKIVEPVNSLAKITDVSLKVKNVMASTIARTTVLLMSLK